MLDYKPLPPTDEDGNGVVEMNLRTA